MRRKAKILFVIAEDWYARTHRFHQMRHLSENGFEVVLATRLSQPASDFEDAGIRVIPMGTHQRDNLNPFRELKTLCTLIHIYRQEKPDILHHVGLKWITNGLIAAFLTKITKSVNVFAGLGYLFLSSKFSVRCTRWCVILLLRKLLRRGNHHLIAQNHDDAKVVHALFPDTPLTIILGAGVDTRQFTPVACPPVAPLVVTLAARMVSNKGIYEAVEAIQTVKRLIPACQLHLVGKPDLQNPTALSPSQLEKWHQQGVIVYRGHQENMAQVYQSSSIAILPSYTEGLPKTLLEAASCGLPLIATDIPGCREVVVEGVNGFLIPTRDAQALANAILTLAQDPDLRTKMGKASRARVLDMFEMQKINQALLALHQDLSTRI